MSNVRFDDKDRPPIRALCILAGMPAIAVLLNGLAIQPIQLNGGWASGGSSPAATNPNLTGGGQSGSPSGTGGSGAGGDSSGSDAGDGASGSDDDGADEPDGDPAGPARSSVIPHSDLRAFLNELDTDSYENAEALYDAAAAFEPTCNLPHAMSNEEVANLYTPVKYECPNSSSSRQPIQ